MSTNSYLTHNNVKQELQRYIKAQYLAKNDLLLKAVSPLMEKENILYKNPYIESTPAYETNELGLNSLNLPSWIIDFFGELAENKLGVYKSPYSHQLQALQSSFEGRDLFISTGTGSGKTECFIWPIIANMIREGREKPDIWKQRGLRTILMYPMNALVSDQVSRLRRLIGDPEDKFLNIFRNSSSLSSRRPQFGMYTGRTPYPGATSYKNEDKKLADTLSKLLPPEDDGDKDYYYSLLKEGKIPAKKNLKEYINFIREGNHFTDIEDAELISRFEIQKICPDILITNYSMLEYMLLRPREENIWIETKKWLDMDKTNRLLFVIDEAHMYRGSAGGEVALLLRRLFNKLGITRNRVQFILTTASMPSETEEDLAAIKDFAVQLSASDVDNFELINSIKKGFKNNVHKELLIKSFIDYPYSEELDDDNLKLKKIYEFFNNSNIHVPEFSDYDQARIWLYYNLLNFSQFNKLLNVCRGDVQSIDELRKEIFPEVNITEGRSAVYSLISIASDAKDETGNLLFPIRMHMMFRGLQGVYACSNPNCKNSIENDETKLGDVFIDNGINKCPSCGGLVYELINDRRCGALFFKGYVSSTSGNSYLWRETGDLISEKLNEIHLYIPTKNENTITGSVSNPIKKCYLDSQSGFINFQDDSDSENPNVIKLYYGEYQDKGRPDIKTFSRCPHCRRTLGRRQLTPFKTIGNQSFYNLIKAQFEYQDPVKSKEGNKEKYPNQGKKVLLFSDSRQRAARLARDMSDASDAQAIMQLFALATNESNKTEEQVKLNKLYGYFVKAAAERKLQLFNNESKEQFLQDCTDMLKRIESKKKRGREFVPKVLFDSAPNMMLEALLQIYCSGYNTVFDTAIGWIIPEKEEMDDALAILEEGNIEVKDEEFIDVFNAWMMDICSNNIALGNNIDVDIRNNISKLYGNVFGLKEDWKFKDVMYKNMGWDKDSKEPELWKEAFQLFLNRKHPENYFIDLNKVVPVLGLTHDWQYCNSCSVKTPFSVKGKCPTCGSKDMKLIDPLRYDAISFWRKPVIDAIEGKDIHLINTEEHTAQLSHKDQRDEMWSRTEQYELKFQDLLKADESPVDILSCTTTMEVGIDIGSLVAVGLRNIPPMRENYQQRAGRAGRRGSRLSTIVTFCEDAPHDVLYFNNPTPMFRGVPRRPWIDTKSEKLVQRHLSLVIIQKFLNNIGKSIDEISTIEYFELYHSQFNSYLINYDVPSNSVLLPEYSEELISKIKLNLNDKLDLLKRKVNDHPELYLVDENSNGKSLLDACYEEGIIPTYSFPKNVVATHIADNNGKLQYQVDRSLDVAISEFAPGRSIVVDKSTYQLGGIYYYGSEKHADNYLTPAKKFIEDPNYKKIIMECPKCGWFGLETELRKGACPLCNDSNVVNMLPMLIPWGFAPINGKKIQLKELNEIYSYAAAPIYSTLPDTDNLIELKTYKNIRKSERKDQRIIVINKGQGEKGFMVCSDCGAAVPGNDVSFFIKDRKVGRPYSLKFCKHDNALNVNLGFDFLTDMFVIEILLDNNKINTNKNIPWLDRAARSLAEALKLKTCEFLDIEFNEINAGYRIRGNKEHTYLDLYIYDSLSSGAGYSSAIGSNIEELLSKTKYLLDKCTCDVSCFKCLRHYRNQNYHSSLDRKAALQLLEWAESSKLAEQIDKKKQFDLVKGLEFILGKYNISISLQNGNNIILSNCSKQVEVVIYPMMTINNNKNILAISDFEIKYAKPLAVDRIKDIFEI